MQPKDFGWKQKLDEVSSIIPSKIARLGCQMGIAYQRVKLCLYISKCAKIQLASIAPWLR
jgi:hypothetical protein